VPLLTVFFLIAPLDGLFSQDLSSLKGSYKPSRSKSPGSVGQESFRRNLAKIFWQKQVDSPLRESVRSFLSRKLYEGESEGQILVLDPGTPPPALPPLSDRELNAVMSDQQLLSQITSRVMPHGDWFGSQKLREKLPPKPISQLESDPEFLELLASWSSREDFMPEVLRILCEIRQNSTDAEWKKYKKIAVAIALVEDQRPPPILPHSQVAPSSLPPTRLSPPEKFRDIVRSDSGGLLLGDVSALSVGEALFLVSHSLPPEDIDWARSQRPSKSRETLAKKSFESVKYDDARVAQGRYTWEEIPYTLDRIRQTGGICIDQAYYADAMCKASGIPSVVFTGTGDAGGHAWVGYLEKNGAWDVGVGRSTGVYMTGKTFNPQNWQTETDHDFIHSLSESSVSAKLEMLLSDIFLEVGEKDLAVTAMTAAGQLAPSDTNLWARKTALLSKLLPPEQVSRRLKSYLWDRDVSPAIKASIKREIARSEREMGRHMSAARMEKAVVEENFSTRSDISSQQLATRIQGLLESGEVGKAMLEYRNVSRSIPPGAAGEFFYNVTRPLVRVLHDGGERTQAIQAAKIARQKINPPKDSLLDLDLRELEAIALKTDPRVRSRPARP
jgi:hypothetical protein